MASRTIVRHFRSDGNAYNLNLGGVPNYVKVINAMAASGEIAVLEWFKEMGDAAEVQWKAIADNGSTAGLAVACVSSGGYISAYDGNAVDAGTSDTDADPCRVTGGAGITIATGFMDDNDEIYVMAVFTDIDDDIGDVA
jgi:hypothetical protein